MSNQRRTNLTSWTQASPVVKQAIIDGWNDAVATRPFNSLYGADQSKQINYEKGRLLAISTHARRSLTLRTAKAAILAIREIPWSRQVDHPGPVRRTPS